MRMPLKAKRRRCRRWWWRRGRGAGWGRRAPSTSPWRRSGTSGPPSPEPSWRWDLFVGLGFMLPCFLPTRVYLHQCLKVDSASRAWTASLGCSGGGNRAVFAQCSFAGSVSIRWDFPGKWNFKEIFRGQTENNVQKIVIKCKYCIVSQIVGVEVMTMFSFLVNV